MQTSSLETKNDVDKKALLLKMRKKLESAGLGYEKIQVFGAIKCNVHVVCVSKNTAEKWVRFLAAAFNGAKISLNKTVWPAAKNTGGNLTPDLRSGYLITAVF